MPEFKGKVLLLGNYLPDQQESMKRFAQIFLDELPKRGIQTELIRPEPVFGKISRNKWFGYVDKLILFPNRLKRLLRTLSRNDVLHICDHSNAVYTRNAAQQPHLATCHDLLAIRSALGEIPENPTRASGRAYQRMIMEGLNRAQKIVCVSEATRRDVLKFVVQVSGCAPSVIYNGLNYPYSPMDRTEAKKSLQKIFGSRAPQRFILHVGGNQWYKNRSAAVRIHQELIKRNPEAPDLLFAGKELPVEIEAMQRIHSIVKCDNETLRALYSIAEALLFPSLAEGFGWPIIEAQACGCPIATSNRAPMTEVGGNAAVYFDPAMIEDAATKLQTLLAESPEARANRIAAGFENVKRFDTSRMIDQYINVYSEITA